MNEPKRTDASAVVPIQEPKQLSLATSGFDPRKGSLESQMLFDVGLNERVNALVDKLANSPTVPRHAKGNNILMFWVLNMHLSTGIPPMALVNGTFDPGGGIIGMTAQLCLTILQGTKSIIGEPEWEQIGDWSKVRGKHKLAGKMPEATYKPEHEAGLGLRLTIHWADKDKPMTYPQSFDEDGKQDAYWMRDCHPRNSPLWATNPLQQMKNYCLRLMTRTTRPAVLNGMSVASGDEMYQGFENAKVIQPEEMTPEEALDDIAGFDDDFNDDDAENYNVDEDGVVTETNMADDEPPADDGKLIAWLSHERPNWNISKPKLEKLLKEAIEHADNLDHLIAIVNNNGALIRKHLSKAARDRLKALEEAKAQNF